MTRLGGVCDDGPARRRPATGVRRALPGAGRDASPHRARPARRGDRRPGRLPRRPARRLRGHLRGVRRRRRRPRALRARRGQAAAPRRSRGGAGGPPAAPTTRPRCCAPSSALELIQACALVHDDLIDDSATRRGEPTVHARWTGAAPRRRLGRATRRASARRSRSCSATSPWPGPTTCSTSPGLRPAALARARPVWQAMRTEVLGGQFLDVAGPRLVRLAPRDRAAHQPVQDRRLHRRAPAAPRGRDRGRRRRRRGRAAPLRHRPRHRLPAARRPARRVRRPGRHRQARRRRPARGQADPARRPGPRTTPTARRPPSSSAPSATPTSTPTGVDRGPRGPRSRSASSTDVERRITELTASALDAVRGAGRPRPGRARPPTRLADLAVAATRRAR